MISARPLLLACSLSLCLAAAGQCARADAGDGPQPEPVKVEDLYLFSGALLAIEYGNADVELSDYVQRLKKWQWAAAGCRWEWEREIERTEVIRDDWLLLGFCLCGEFGAPIFEWMIVVWLDALRDRIGCAAYYRGEMPPLPEGLWIREWVIPSDRQPMPKGPP